MGWQGSVHGEWCHSKTYPTTCRYCGARVFFFTCDCGCKVFFNSLGPPWPTHLCREYVQSILGPERMARVMADYMMTPLNWGPGSGVEEHYTRGVVQRERQAAPPVPRLVRQDPVPGAAFSGLGHLREIVSQIDVFRLLGIPADSIVGFQLLGPWARQENAQLTLHAGDLSKEDGQSYTCLVAQNLLLGARAKRGDEVFFSLGVLNIPGLKPVWICDVIEVV